MPPPLPFFVFFVFMLILGQVKFAPQGLELEKNRKIKNKGGGEVIVLQEHKTGEYQQFTYKYKLFFRWEDVDKSCTEWTKKLEDLSGMWSKQTGTGINR